MREGKILPDVLRVSLLQWNILRDSPDHNIAIFQKLLEIASAFEPHLVILPEMWTRGFCGRALEMEAKMLPARLDFCRDQARGLNAWIAAGTLPEPAPGGKVFNTFFLLDPAGEVRLVYRKVHLFPLTKEPVFFAPGEAPGEICESGNWRIGAGICFDLRFPELFRAQMKRGANLFIIPAQFPKPRKDQYQILSRARAIENLAFFAGVNRVGEDRELGFFGASSGIGPLGNIIAEAGEGEEVLNLSLDFREVLEVRQRFPFLENTPLL